MVNQKFYLTKNSQLRNYLKTQNVIPSAARNLFFSVSQTLRSAQGDVLRGFLITQN